MNFEPQKFFIGLMDFFSILLPGALLTYLLMGEVGLVVLGDRYTQLSCEQAWTAFLFASYLFGHLVFLLGSWLDEFARRRLGSRGSYVVDTGQRVRGLGFIIIDDQR